MSQKIATDLKSANVPLLNEQLKAALPTVCDGLVGDKFGLYIILDDSATQADIAQALAIAAAHDPNQDTAEQAKEKAEQAAVAAFLAAADKDVTLAMCAGVLRHLVRQLGQG